jgi:mycoredoxin
MPVILNQSENSYMSESAVTMYSTTWCGYCRRLKRQMDEAGIPYEEIDVDQDHGFDGAIMEASGGYRVVPTLNVGGELLVNPTIQEVRRALSTN